MSETSIYAAVPEAMRPAVERAALAAFGAAPEAAEPLLGGQSGALTLKLTVGGRAYVLRAVKDRTQLSDPQRQFAALGVAASLGVAPPLRWADADAGICIMDYIEARPLIPALRAGEASAAQLGRLLRTVHDGPAFLTLLDAFGFIDGGLATLAGLELDLPAPLSAYLERFPAVRAALRPHLTLAPIHHDPNPGNLLFDGERIWLIDWETACMDDPYFDLAAAIIWVAGEPALEEELLGGYFQAAPTPWQRAKLELMKQVAYCFYGVVFCLLGANGGQAALDEGAAVAPPRFADALRAVGAGELALDVPANGVSFGLSMIGEALAAQQLPAFAEALAALAADGGAPS